MTQAADIILHSTTSVTGSSNPNRSPPTANVRGHAGGERKKTLAATMGNSLNSAGAVKG